MNDRSPPCASLHVPVERLAGAEDLPLPAPATGGAAGLDLPAAVDGELVLEPGQRELVPTGLRIAIPSGYEGQVRPRSGLALHHGIVLPNAPGTIDSDYRGELKVIVWNAGPRPFVIRRGDRIAQLVVAPVVRIVCDEVPELDATARGAGGFGHTGQGLAEDPREDPQNEVRESRRDGVPEDRRDGVPEDRRDGVPEDRRDGVPEDRRDGVREDRRDGVREDRGDGVANDARRRAR